MTEPLYLDVQLPPNAAFQEPLPQGHNAFVYVIDGILHAHDMDDAALRLRRDDLGILARGDLVSLTAGSESAARFLLIAGRPLNEPVARGGPFVMNTKAEIRQANDDVAQVNTSAKKISARFEDIDQVELPEPEEGDELGWGKTATISLVSRHARSTNKLC